MRIEIENIITANSKNALNENQIKMMTFILEKQLNKEPSPSIREIAERVYGSDGLVDKTHRGIKELLSNQFLTREEGKVRTMKVNLEKIVMFVKSSS